MKLLLTLLFSLFLFYESDELILFEQPTINDIAAFEESKSGKLIPQSSGISYSISPSLCPEVEEYDFAEPVKYARPGKDMPPLDISYYYSKSDSTVRCVTYTVWYPQDGSLADKELSFYQGLFEITADNFSKDLGQPDMIERKFRDNKMRVKWEKEEFLLTGSLSSYNKRIRYVQRWVDQSN